ncbi:hypothetical protein P7C71_g3957, partial [Lecanoromycetidae sp. Uapishka_2]
MTALPLYIYSPLDEEASEIRLMTLHPSERAWSKICVTLENHVLREGETPPYEALSYTWGTPKWPLKIFVQGDQNASLNVTQNLESALRHLRYADRPRVMWIDATCVDQQNLEERSQQVKRMADVFRLAGRVLIWLGPEADDSTLALRTLADVGSKVTADWTAQMMAPKGDADDEWIDPKFDFPFDNNTWTAINALLYRPWFERLWIWQEVRFASSVLNTTNYVGGGSMLEAMCYTFCKGIFSEYYIPLDPNCLVFQDLKKLMKSLARVQGDIPQETISANERTLEYVSKECQGASFAVTREGYIGLVPSNSIIGDQICVLLGCQSPLVLRKSGVKDYLLVGECYVYGVSQGAALLGPLSGGWQAVLRYDQEAEGYYRAFINDDTGAVQMEDPRIGPLPDGWRVASHTYQDAYDLYATDSTGEEPTRFDPRMSPEALRERGVKLEEFRLV